MDLWQYFSIFLFVFFIGSHVSPFRWDKIPPSDVKIWLGLGKKLWCFNKFIHKTHQKDSEIMWFNNNDFCGMENMHYNVLWDHEMRLWWWHLVNIGNTSINIIGFSIKDIRVESLVPIWLICLLLILSSDSIDDQSITSPTVVKSIERIQKPWMWVISCL